MKTVGVGRLKLFFILAGACAVQPAFACMKFSQIPQTFIRDLGLDEKKAKLRFRPLKFPKGLAGFLVQDDTSCSLRGSCDSVIYLLSRESGCYRQGLAFRGRWQGVESENSFRIQSDGIPSVSEIYRVEP